MLVASLPRSAKPSAQRPRSDRRLGPFGRLGPLGPLARRARCARCVVPLLALALLAACSSDGSDASDNPGAPPAAPDAATASEDPQQPGAGPYRAGDCVTTSGHGAPTKISCDEAHEYEVMLSAEFPVHVPHSYPPPVRTEARPTCRATLPDFLGSANADATRLATVTFWPTQQEWERGDRWFACLVAETGPDSRPVPRTGSLAGVLAGGLGQFQQCLVDEPVSAEPTRVVPCDQPHRSEAVPGVLVLGAPSDPPPGIEEMADRSADYCAEKVNAYLGGSRAGVRPVAVPPLPEQWASGSTSVICYVVSETPVSGTLNKG